MEALAFPYPPWPDLQDPLLEIILERLPLPDYVRFAAVCRRWRSVQSSHRRRHSPPMLRLPWFVIDYQPFRVTLSFYSPSENKFFPKVPAVPATFYIRTLPACGRLLMVSDDHYLDDNIFRLLNPISGDKIDLPPWPDPDPILSDLVVGFSPPPNYTVSTVDSTGIYVFRWFDSGWVKLNVRGGLKTDKRTAALSINGKHYYILPGYMSLQEESFSVDLLVVDPLSSPPTFEYFEMTGRNQVMRNESGCSYSYGVSYLVESDGEPLLVNEILKGEKNCGKDIVRYEVFRADLGRKIWVRAESIGDSRALMFHDTCSVSLLAADIGAAGNCIYFSTVMRNARVTGGEWKVFEIRTGRVTDLLLPDASQFEDHDYWLFMPSLC